MSVKKNKILTDIVIFLFALVKVIVFSSTENLGFSLDSEVEMEVYDIAFLLSALFYSVSVTILIRCILKRQGEKMSGVCIYLLAEPLSFLAQKNTISMLIVGAAMLFAAVAIKNKSPINKIAGLILSLVVMMALAPETFFGFVPAVVMLYVLSEKNAIDKKAVKALSASSVAAILAGLCINVFLIRGSESVETEFERFVSLNVEVSIVYYVFIIPSLALSLILFSLMMSVNIGKDKDKNPENIKIAKAARFVILTSIISTFFFSKLNLYTVSFLPTVALAVLMNNENQYAIKTIDKINRFIEENRSVFLVVIILAVYIFTHILLRYAHSGCFVSEFIFT